MRSDGACDAGRASTRRASPLTPRRSLGATGVRVLAVYYYCCCRTLCLMQDLETRCISPVSVLCMPSYSAGNPYPKISAKISAQLSDIKYMSDRPIYRKTSVPMHSPIDFRFPFDVPCFSCAVPCVQVFCAYQRNYVCIIRTCVRRSGCFPVWSMGQFACLHLNIWTICSVPLFLVSERSGRNRPLREAPFTYYRSPSLPTDRHHRIQNPTHTHPKKRRQNTGKREGGLDLCQRKRKISIKRLNSKDTRQKKGTARYEHDFSNRKFLTFGKPRKKRF